MHPARPKPHTRPIFSEMGQIARLAVPIYLAQLLTAAAGFFDTLMSGWAGVSDLAGVAMGSAVWTTLGVAVMGLFMAVNPIVAQYRGAGDLERIPNFMHQAARLATLAALGLFVLLRLHDLYLPQFVDDPTVIRIAGDYLDGFSWGVPAFLGYMLLRPYSEGMAFTRPHMVASAVGLAVNIPANYVLIFGKLGLPELGGAGCGYATALSLWSSFGIMWAYSRRHPAYDAAPIYVPLHPLDRPELRHLLQVGIPVFITLFVEVSIFSLITLFLGGRPSAEIGANQIAMNVAYLIFTLPLSIAIAGTIRVGTHVGGRRPEAARRAGFAAMALALGAATVNVTILTGFAAPIANLYTDDTLVASLAAQLLLFAALFQFSDGLVTPALGALRGYKDTRVPLLLAILAYWGVTLPLGYGLGLTDLGGAPMGAEGFWIALVVGLALGALLMVWRFEHVSRIPGDNAVANLKPLPVTLD